MNPAFETVTKGAKLVTLPDIYLRLKEILDGPDYAMAEVAIVISQDPSTTLRLLNLVNSSFYGFVNKVETVSRAITLLGTTQVHDLVLATSVAQAFSGMSTEVMDMETFWTRSIFCAVASRNLAAISGKCDKERLFVSGLLHEIGHLIMYQTIPGLAQQAILSSQEKEIPIQQAERDLIGFDYALVGGILMEQWNLPDCLRESTLYHLEPQRAENFPVETSLVHIAGLLTNADHGQGVFNEGILCVDGSVWEITELSAEQCISVLEKIREEVHEAMDIVFPNEFVS